MSKQLQFRGGTTLEHSTFTGADREVTVDTDKRTLILHDGMTAGGKDIVSDFYTKTAIDDKAKEWQRQLSKVASSVLLNQSSLSFDDSAITKNFATVTYTGNGTAQDIVTGISSVDFTVSGNGSGYWLDRTVNQVKNDAGVVVDSGSCVVNTSKVHIKSRTDVDGHQVFDSIRGVENTIQTSSTNTEAYIGTGLSSFSENGFSIGSWTVINDGTPHLYIAYQTLYTHIKWGVTSQGKFQIEAYNPVTREGMIYYLGSGVAGHEISHSQGVEIDYLEQKNLTNANSWRVYDVVSGANYVKYLNATNANTADTSAWSNTAPSEINITVGNAVTNTIDAENIMYYKCKSETFTIDTYQGTGAAGNFVETRDVNGVARKPRRVVVKSISGTGSWVTVDTERGADKLIYLESSGAEIDTNDYLVSSVSGFTLTTISSNVNTSGGQYLYLVEFDTNGDGGDSYFDLPTDDSNINITGGHLQATKGKDEYGFINSTRDYTGSLDFTGIADGIKYVGLQEDNTVVAYDGVSIGSYEKQSADDNRLVFNTEDGKWYEEVGGELVTNGTFDTDVSGWTAISFNGTTNVEDTSVASVNGSLTLTNSAGKDYPEVEQEINLTIGEEYTCSVDISQLSTTCSLGITEDTSISAGWNTNSVKTLSISDTGTYSFTFVATANSLFVKLIINSNIDGYTVIVDNISVYKVEPTLSVTPTDPISFLPYPIQIQSETPQAIMYDMERIPENVMGDTMVDGDLEVTGEFKGKNACTAWVNFDGTTTPPTIRDSFNVSDVVRTATGIFEIYFDEAMDNLNYSSSCISHRGDAAVAGGLLRHGNISSTKLDKVIVLTGYVNSSVGTAVNNLSNYIQIYGGKE